MPGVGKSTLGKKIAKQLDWDWIDLDEFIAQKYEASIGQIVTSKGQEVFRAFEQKSLLEMLDKPNTVISCGGGTPAYFDNAKKMLASGLCIYLDADIKFISSRISIAKQERFMFQNLNNEEVNLQLESIFKERKVYFENAQLLIKIPITDFQKEMALLKSQLLRA
jgi:shikimate kinase